jgi:DNA ligase-1
MATLDDGDEVQVKGSTSTYTLSRRGAVFMCTCPAWRNQGAVIDRRTCKHLRAYLGDAVETARVGAASTARGAPKRAPGAAPAAVDEPAEEAAAPVLLAHKWEPDHDPTGWWMSEKLDGVRAYWDGAGFVSRLGKKFFAPAWFIADLPAEPLDGELWVGRKMFSRTISIVRSGAADAQWQQVSYVVFDAPGARGGFEARIAHVDRVLKQSGAPHARALAHVVCEGLDHLRAELARVEALGGEGLMLRRPGSPYEIGRSGSLLKVKTFHDAEAIIVGHAPGTGRHEGRLGAVVAELPDGTRFNVGTGFSDAERDDPPPIGSVITFRYQELTDDGVPRFPSWVGVRLDAEWPPRSAARPIGEVPARPAAPARKSTVAKAAARPAAIEPAATAVAPAAGAPADFTVRLVHPTDDKFWQIEVRGAAHTIRFGKVGSAGQTRSTELASAAAARADADKRAQAKRKDGYVPIER